MDTIEMVSTTCKTILTGLIEIITEVLIGLSCAFRGLNHDKTNGTLINTAVVFKVIPIDTSLMMGDIDTMDLITFWVVDCAVECTPTKAKGTDKEIVEEPNVAQNNCSASYPPTPEGIFCKSRITAPGRFLCPGP